MRYRDPNGGFASVKGNDNGRREIYGCKFTSAKAFRPFY